MGAFTQRRKTVESETDPTAILTARLLSTFQPEKIVTNVEPSTEIPYKLYKFHDQNPPLYYDDKINCSRSKNDNNWLNSKDVDRVENLSYSPTSSIYICNSECSFMIAEELSCPSLSSATCSATCGNKCFKCRQSSQQILKTQRPRKIFSNNENNNEKSKSTTIWKPNSTTTGNIIQKVLSQNSTISTSHTLGSVAELHLCRRNNRKCIYNKSGSKRKTSLSLISATLVQCFKLLRNNTCEFNKRTSVITSFGLTSKTVLSSSRKSFRSLPSIGATSFLTLFTIICLETVLLSTMSNCAKTFYMHWNTSNSIFRIDNTDHIIDVNKGNLAFEFDQVHIICPVYEPGTFENETEKYIIYNVSKVEYETCRITNADPRVIAICDKPQKLMFFTITFRPFTPQPGGLEFLPGNDYYFISTSSKDDLYRRIGGRCSTNNMKVVFKVCCAEEKNKTTSSGVGATGGSVTVKSNKGDKNINLNVEGVNNDLNGPTNINNQHAHIHNINTVGMNGVSNNILTNGGININAGSNDLQIHPVLNSPGSTSINTNIDQFNRIPMQTNGINVLGNNLGGVGFSSHSGSGVLLSPGSGGINMIPTGGVGGIAQYPGHSYHGQTGIRINNVPSQHHPNLKNNNNINDDHYEKHPNEVVKNEELTYNSAASSRCFRCHLPITIPNVVMEIFVKLRTLACYRSWEVLWTTSLNSLGINLGHICKEKSNMFNYLVIKFVKFRNVIFNLNPIALLSIVLIFVGQCMLQCNPQTIMSLSKISTRSQTEIMVKTKKSGESTKLSQSIVKILCNLPFKNNKKHSSTRTKGKR